MNLIGAISASFSCSVVAAAIFVANAVVVPSARSRMRSLVNHAMPSRSLYSTSCAHNTRSPGRRSTGGAGQAGEAEDIARDCGGGEGQEEERVAREKQTGSARTEKQARD